jgi:hypothetical protein
VKCQHPLGCPRTTQQRNLAPIPQAGLRTTTGFFAGEAKVMGFVEVTHGVVLMSKGMKIKLRRP